MQRFRESIIFFLLLWATWGCSELPEQSWIHLIPAKSTFVVIPEPGTSLATVPNTTYASVLDDLTQSPLQQLAALNPDLIRNIQLKGLVIYPTGATESELIWITHTDSELALWASDFYRPFEQNNYQFNGITIQRLHINNTLVFAAQVHNWLVISASSLATESALRSYLGLAPTIELTSEPEPGFLVLNAESLDHWVQQFAAVAYRPSIMGSFTGLQPAPLSFTPIESDKPGFNISGVLTLKDTTHAVLMDALTSENAPISLDRYVASNAAAFALFRLKPHLAPRMPEVAPTALDSLLISNNELYRDLALSLQDEFGLVVFPESGLLANGEYLFLRALESVATIKNKFVQLANRGLVLRQGNTFYVESEVMAKLIGSEMAPFSDFYLSFSNNVAVISKRRGLSESVEADRVRRRTVYYEETYSKFKKTLPSELSGFVWVYTDDFLKFLQPFLMGNTPLNGLLGQYDITAMSFFKNEHSNTVNFEFRSVEEEGSTQPYNELWVLPLQGDELSAPPVFADIVGSSTDEIIFSTKGGKVQALAFDGTLVMQATTANGDTPIGSPVLYDWYGNGKPIIMQAAGTRIYAWNEGGRALPQFPIEIGERISAPIVVTDVLRNGIPEIIVATENRKIHVINGRGQNVRGWPQFTNAIVTQKPVFAEVDGNWSIWVFSQNILHSWLRNGQVRPGYPTFVNATFTTPPTIFNNQILGAASDGYIYSIGKNPSFSDSLAISVQMDSISIKSLYATSSRLNAFSVSPNVLLKDNTLFYRSDLFITQSENGSVLMFNPNGELELTHNLGQPSSPTMAPLVVDLNGDNNYEVLALADFGRLFAWEILTGRRIFNIPTSGMTYPVVGDLNKDGRKELIAFTREGLRCWTINKQE